MRTIELEYQDPLDLVWLATAQELGMTIRRSSEVFASWDGAGTLTLGTAETLDPDDSLAQLIFHEICHALVEGPECWNLPDWGLGNRRLEHEHACLRLQAKLADPYGLRKFLASTTDFRSFYDRLADDPFAAEDATVSLAQAGWQRAQQSPWQSALEKGLGRTAQIAKIVRPLATHNSLWSKG